MTIEFSVKQKIALISINRPQRRNAVDMPTAKALHDAFRRFEADESLFVAILTGMGGHFCAGADLKVVADGEKDRVSEDAIGPMGPTRMQLKKPVIAAIEGYAVAGGLELASWCDLRVAANNATLGVYCRRFGVPLVDMGTIRLPRLIGHSRAMDLILTGRSITAEEAYEIGLVNRLAEPGAAIDVALHLAEELAAFPQTCMRNDRLSAIEQWDMDWDTAMRNETRRGLVTLQSGETQKGARKFKSGAGRHGKKLDR